jgi:hypothetical protein
MVTGSSLRGRDASGAIGADRDGAAREQAGRGERKVPRVGGSLRPPSVPA